MHSRRKEEVQSGPALKAEQVSEFWVWIWSAIQQFDPDKHPAERDEAQRLAVAFERAIDRIRAAHDYPRERFIRDQSPLSAALLAHYLLTRLDHFGSMNEDAGAQQRVFLLTETARLLGTMLGVQLHSLAKGFQGLKVGSGPGMRSVFRPETREGVIIESFEEGPALPAERAQREAEAYARFQARCSAEAARPKRRRQLEEVPR